MNNLYLLVSIVYLDLTLSGDNALLLGGIISEIPCQQCTLTLLISGMGIIILRTIMIFSVFAMTLYPFTRILLGILLLIITLLLCRTLINRLNKPTLASESPLTKRSDLSSHQSNKLLTHTAFIKSFLYKKKETYNTTLRYNFLRGVLSIIAADVLTSVDNTIALGTVFKGNVLILTFALLISIIILFSASTLISNLIQRHSCFLLVAISILAKNALTSIIGTTSITAAIIYTSLFLLILLSTLASIRLLRTKQLRRCFSLCRHKSWNVFAPVPTTLTPAKVTFEREVS